MGARYNLPILLFYDRAIRLYPQRQTPRPLRAWIGFIPDCVPQSRAQRVPLWGQRNAAAKLAHRSWWHAKNSANGAYFDNRQPLGTYRLQRFYTLI